MAKKTKQARKFMRLIKTVLLVALVVFVAACSSKFKTYNGPEVTRIIVMKGDRVMYLMHNDEVLKKYDIDLGFAPSGHKQIEGDGKTPVGDYFINRRNPDSAFHLSLGISYPNNADRATARALGKPTGGDIFIHGASTIGKRRGEDWTAGCISVSNREMEKIYAMVQNGTPISLRP